MQFNFDARNVQPSGGGVEMWPTGWYPVVIQSVEPKPVQSGGSRLALQVEAIDGPFRGKKNYISLNIQHSNPQVIEIAYKQLSAICWVVGLPVIQDTQQLVGRPFLAYAKVGEKGNNFDNFKDMNGNEALAIATGQVQAGGAPAGMPSQPPGQAPGQAPGPQPGQFQQPPQQQQPQPSAGTPAWGGQQPGGAPAWGGGAPQGQPAQQPPAQQPQAQPPAPGGAPWGGPAPQQQGQPQQPQQPQWQQQPPQQPAPGGGAPAAPWGGGAPQGPAAGGAPPWGAR